MLDDLRAFLRLAKCRNEQPLAAILDSLNGQSSPECGAQAGYEGHKSKNGTAPGFAPSALIVSARAKLRGTTFQRMDSCPVGDVMARAALGESESIDSNLSQKLTRDKASFRYSLLVELDMQLSQLMGLLL